MTTRGKVALIIGIAAASFFAGFWVRQKPESATAASAGRRILYYHDPMHPAYKSDKPGVAPDCGMQLEPVYADGGEAAEREHEAAPAGTITVSPEKQQLIGVKIAEVSRNAGPEALRVPGRVVADETRIFRISAATSGWIRQVGPAVSGSIVKKDELLATFYNRDFLTAQQTYLYALNTTDRFKDTETPEQLKLTGSQVRASLENLEFLGMGDTQLREIERTRQVARNVELRSPVAGQVLARGVFPGLPFDRGAELFRIADLSHVWVYADVYEHDAWLVRATKSAVVSRQGGRALAARISDTLPQFDPATRTLKVRLDVDNPDYALRPDMFMEVEFRIALPASISVPAEAVVDSGLRKTVYVDRGNGHFEPRPVETTWRFGDRVGIGRGLQAGERIVVAGNFLIDSESRMQAAAARPELVAQAAARASAGAETHDPVCGMDVDPAKAPHSEYQGKSYYFCSPNCKHDFDANPAKYAKK
jgi:Cu(I)/Ag(I) efflux system membrane fusion protein